MKTNKVTKLHYEAATGYRDGLFWCSYRQKVVTTIHQRTQYHTSASQAGNIFLLKRPFKIGWIAHQCGWFNNTKLKAIFLNQMCVLHFWFVFFLGGVGGGVGLYNARFIIDNIDHYKSILSSKIHIFQSYHTVVIPCCLCECWILQLF